MKRIFLIISLLVIAFPFMLGNPAETGYIVLSWNDLGMHCANKDFSTLVVLPPYNNIRAQVIKKGDASTFPQVITQDLKVMYSIPGNTYSVGKTNFWDYANAIFGVTLSPNIGLTGAGLSGSMNTMTGYFLVLGVPITPYQDSNLVTEDPFQQALIQVYDMSDNLLASSRPVVPVSNEINCVSSGCHQSEQAILNSHELEGGFDPNAKPVLCAKCHASNALGTVGNHEAGNFSFRIHTKHQFITDCYKCHPGPNTRCLRDVMFSAGNTCTDCHGSMNNVGTTAETGRRPWLDEPSCSQSGCHSDHYAPESGKLYKDSKGHGGLFCSACHGSPHAIYPSINPRDNQQIVDLQGFSGKLKDCKVCHGITPNMAGPHGVIASNVETIKLFDNTNSDIYKTYPNPSRGALTVPFRINISGYVKIDAYDLKGNKVATFVNEALTPGEYKSDINMGFLPNGSYNLIMSIANKPVANERIIINK